MYNVVTCSTSALIPTGYSYNNTGVVGIAILQEVLDTFAVTGYQTNERYKRTLLVTRLASTPTTHTHNHSVYNRNPKKTPLELYY